MYKYETKQELPRKGRGRPIGSGKYPFLFMQDVGDRFFVPRMSRKTAWTLCKYWSNAVHARGMQYNYTVETIDGTKGCWIQRTA